METLKSALSARFEGDKVAIRAIEGGYNNGDSVYTLPSDRGTYTAVRPLGYVKDRQSTSAEYDTP